MVFLICSCYNEKKKIDCDKRPIVQKCLDILSAKNGQGQGITIINNETFPDSIPLFWKKTPIIFRRDSLKDIHKLISDGGLYLLVDKVSCEGHEASVGIIIINANARYEFTISKIGTPSEKIELGQITDDVLGN